LRAGAVFALTGRVYRDAIRLFSVAIIIPLIAIVPEFLQHVWEINAGMFASKSAFQALSFDAGRLNWGYLKVAGLLITTLAAARFWGTHNSGESFWAFNWWGQVAMLAGTAVMVVGFFAFRNVMTSQAGLLSLAVLGVVTAPLMAWQIAPLAGVHDYTLARAFREGWRVSNRMGMLLLCVAIPIVALYYALHIFVLGKPIFVVWTVMTLDALLIGLLATAMGVAMHHGFVGQSVH
jgi:hypothetical protein